MNGIAKVTGTKEVTETEEKDKLAPEEWLGKLVEVLTDENKLIFMGHVTEVSNGEVRIDPRTGDAPPSMYNTKVKLRVLSADGALSVASGSVCGCTVDFWRVHELEGRKMEEKREYFRQNVNITANIHLYTNKTAKPVDPKPEEEKKDIKPYQSGRIKTSSRFEKKKEVKPPDHTCYILDISGGGALIKSREDLEVGDYIRVEGAVIVKGKQPFDFDCYVMRKITDDSVWKQYGCRFAGLSAKEEDRLLEAIFIAQRYAITKMI